MGLSFSLADIFTNRKEENGSFFFLFMTDFFGFWMSSRPCSFEGFSYTNELCWNFLSWYIFCVRSFINSILTWSCLFDIRKFKKLRIFKILKPLKFFVNLLRTRYLDFINSRDVNSRKLMKRTGYKVKFNGKPDIINSDRLRISSYFYSIYSFLSSDGFIFFFW